MTKSVIRLKTILINKNQWKTADIHMIKVLIIDITANLLDNGQFASPFGRLKPCVIIYIRTSILTKNNNDCDSIWTNPSESL